MEDGAASEIEIHNDGIHVGEVPRIQQGNGENLPQAAGGIYYSLGFNLPGNDARPEGETLQFIRRVQDEVDEHLSSGDIKRMIAGYERQCPPAARRDITPRTIHRLFEVLLETSKHCFLVCLQGLLHHVLRSDLSDRVADLAEPELERLQLPFFSKANPVIIPALPAGALRFKILVDREFYLINEEVINIRSMLAQFLQVEESSIIFARLNMANSVWVTVLAPAQAVQALCKAIGRQDVQNYLASMHIKKFVPPTEAEMTSPQVSESQKSPSEESKLYDASRKKKSLKTWSQEDVLEHFRHESSPEIAEALEKLKMEGKNLASWNPALLRNIGLSDEQALGVTKGLDKLGVFDERSQFKVINDNIHGFIFLHPLCMKIIDTPQFQRLRNIKQLGAVYHVFPAASHNRFEHSLGVGHLAYQVVTALQERQPALDITEEDVLCVTIAGLCHDLGQGPYSSLFTRFIHTVNKNEDWKPEDTAVKVFDHLIKVNDLKPAMKEAGLTDTDVEFIREQIAGTPVDRETPKGRPKEKHFLYEIIGQRQNGIDVVKWDEIARDSFMLGVPNNFDHKRFIAHVRALQTSRGWRLCPRDIDADHHFTMFQDEFFLGRRAYFHPASQAIEAMLEDVLHEVEKAGFNSTLSKEGGEFKLSKCVDDAAEFCKLTDSFFHAVEVSTCDELKEARKTLESVQRRRLYRMVAETNPKHKKISHASVLEKVSKVDGIRVKIAYMEYSWLDSHDNQDVFFYRKGKPQTPITLNPSQVSVILPTRFAECIVRLFSKDHGEETKENARKEFGTWCSDNGMEMKPSLTDD